MSDNIKVVVKVRPLITREIEDKQQHQWRVSNNTLYQLDSNGRDFGQSFTFDKVYSEDTKTSDVYNDVAKPIVEAAVAGFNGTIFAYGQTSSGKTYTMTGTDESPGIIPLAVLNLFEIIKNVPGRDFVVSVSYIELYNETLKDLLDLKKSVISIHQTYSGVKVEATEKVTASPEEVLEVMKVGNANRQTAVTNMNESSSRSHSIFQISIESREHIEGEEQAECVNVSQLNLVDLAGSERAGQTGATGIRFKEGTSINKSLTSLALVIKQLSEDQKFVNYRDSKLTRILQNSLGGNAKTCIICAITPAALEETNSTLQFATRAKTIKNKPSVNAVATSDATMIQKLTKELSMLKSTLESKKNLEVMLKTKMNVEQDLQKKIANLQRFILNGCSQHPNVELMGGARRKLLPPRRITISTLHPIEEDIPKVPKFSTPSLKYNPSLIQNTTEFMPIDNLNKLSTLPEEPPRLITPPPKASERKVNFSDEVIEVDSDDDDCPEETCSPYHECYSASKTPPCVLRKNAKQAERNLKDLVELTDREKMYSPDVVELIEKIEQSSKTTAKLQDEIEVLKSASKEKDLEIEELRSKIKNTDQCTNNFTAITLELETQNKQLSTELTDWQVSYETLKNKYKLREQELLSLLQEQRIKQADDIGKIPFKEKDKEIIHLMDMSKDISLINSDNESSIVGPDDATEPSNILRKDMQAQLATKNQIIKDLELYIKSQKEQIQLLETSSHDLLSQVDSFKEKLSYFKNENELLRSTVCELNCTVKSQKENLESVQNDIKSYNSVIQELQIKLTTKENLPDVHISEADLESMMTNEDKTIANNENIKNVIHSLKLALENSKKEVDLLKSKMQNNNESGDKNSVDELKVKTEDIEMLNAEIAMFTKQATENMELVDSLLREKNDSALAEQELVKKLSELEEQIKEYDILNKEQALQIDYLKKDNKRLETTLADREQLSIMNETLVKQVHEAKNRIIILEEDIKSKKLEIDNLNTKNNEFQDCLNKAKLAINKLEKVFTILTGEVREIPEILDSFVNVYSSLNDNLNMLEQIAIETISQKDLIQRENNEFKIEIDTLVLQHELQISKSLEETENLTRSIQDHTSELKLLNERNSDQLIEIETLKHELNEKNVRLNNFEKQVKVFRETDIHDVISSLKENETFLLEKIINLETETNNYASPSKSQEDRHKDLRDKEEICSQKLNELNDQLKQKCAELTQVKETLQANQEANDQLIESIIRKLNNVIDNIKEKNASIKNSLMIESSKVQGPNSILSLLDTVVDHVIMQSSMELENEKLKSEINILSNNNKSLECDLKQSSELLQQIREELKIKSAEIDTMKEKAKQWKKQFIDLDLSMKEQMHFLHSENEKLKMKSLNLHEETEMKLHLLEETGNTKEITPIKSITKPSAGCENIKENALPSLFKMCCNKIIEAADNKRNENISIKTPTYVSNTEPAPNTCLECDQLGLELRTIQQENMKLTNIVEQLEILNEELTKEHNEMSEEVYSLVELTQVLQKKIANHRTNLSILTATTYTENKSLQSQVKGLQHHHSRFHNVCQRDIPEFKKQLHELMTLLKDDSSFCDALNSSSIRYSLTNLLESTLTSNQTRNESALDGDLLMLDTNVTLTTADNTLVGYNQTCLDLTLNVFNETDCQTGDHNLADTNALHKQIDILKCNNEDLSVKLVMLTDENIKLKDQAIEDVEDSKVKDTQVTNSSIQIIEMKDSENECILKELERLTEQLSVATKKNKDIEQKYNDLLLEMPSTDALVHKMKITEEDYKNKVKELTKTLDNLNAMSKELKAMQVENDLLSTQVMEHISEIDDLNKEVEELKQQNIKLLDQCQALEVKKIMQCPKCEVNDGVPNIDARNEESHSKLNRSLSDSHTTSRHNKICTLQSEIHAGREDCKVLTEDVVTIKHHLDQSNLSMDLDESLNFELANESVSSSPQSRQCNMPNIQEEQLHEVYITDKNDCYKYYLEKTGIENKNLTSNTRIIEVMKSLYENVVTRHGNEVENLANKLRDFEESHANLKEQISIINADYSKTQKDLDERDKSLHFITKVITQLKDNLSVTEEVADPDLSMEGYAKNTEVLKNKFLSVLDKQFNLSSIYVFEQIEGYTNKLFEECSSINEILTQTKQQLLEKEKECTLLKAQNDKIHEINNAVTLDIIKKEQEDSNIIKETYQKLVELEIISPDKVSISEPFSIHILIRLLEHFINEYQKEKAKGHQSQEIDEFKAALSDKERQLNELRSQYEIIHGVNINNTKDISEKEEQVKQLKALHDELNSALNSKIEENSKHVTLIQNLSDEIYKLKNIIRDKEKMLESVYENETRVQELLNSVKNLHDGNEKLKAANEMISNEAKSYAIELEKSCATIKQNNLDIHKMTSDILALRESMKEASAHVETFKQEVQALTKENTELKQNLEIKTRDCSRLEVNIKTHEKTAEIQSRMIMRLQKLKEEDDKAHSKLTNELNEKYTALQAECEELRNTIKTLDEELEQLKAAKQSLEHRLADAEENGRRSRSSIDAVARRRQSLHDAKRQFEESEENKNLEAVFESRQKTDDFFDDDLSDRSTPFGHGKGRDSLLSRTDHSDKDDELSRPSSALAKAARRRRQSSHDLHRSVTPHAPSPSDLSNLVIDEMQQLEADTLRNRLHSDNEITQLKAQLAAYETELEELKEKNRELDEECDTCAEYLREREQQCIRLKKEKAALENQIMELKTKSATPDHSMSFRTKPSVAHVAVNTDEDWTNLHSVVVDRMSYDAEVEKNKRLTKTIEELRFTKMDLKNTLAKMQKALEKNSSNNSRELDQMKKQLKASNDELRELRKRYKELDEECDTCAKYLKEREEQCRRLTEAKTALEAKLEELQEHSHTAEHTKSVRKKRQTVHDMNRPDTTTDQMDVSTETTNDLLTSHLARDDSVQAANESSRDIDYFKKMVERLTQQKMHLELQLRTAQVSNPMFVATGSAIVQNQQITDVMKENQQLKKINAKLVNICRKRGKSANRENEDPSEQG